MPRINRKVVLIIGFQTPDRPLSRVEKGYNRENKKHGKPQVSSATSSGFLTIREKPNKRPGFPEFELLPGESPQSAIRRIYSKSDFVIKKPWQQITNFSHTEHKKEWEILVGIVTMDHTHPAQRGMDIAEQSDELPFSIEWQKPDWLYLQNRNNLLSYLTSLALSKPEVRAFLQATQHQQAA